MRTRRRGACLISAMVLLISAGIDADPSAGQDRFRAELSGNEEVPPVNTRASGSAVFQTSQAGGTVTYTLRIAHIKDITGARVCKGNKGENGPVVADLFREPKREDISGTLFAEGSIEPYLLSGELQGRSVSSLIKLMATGEVYINILTKRCPNGEIRGQIRSQVPD